MKSSHQKPIRALASALVFCPLLAPAALISHESFSGYSTGVLSGSDPAPAVAGYTGNWYNPHGTGPSFSATSLVYSDPLYAGSSGGGAIANTGAGRAVRNLAAPLVVTNSTVGTLYLSFLVSGGAHYKALELHDGGAEDANRNFQLGVLNNPNGTGSYVFGADNTGYTSTGVAVGAAVSLFVVKFDLSDLAGGDSITVWGNPTLGGTGDPTGGVTLSGLNLTWDRLALADFVNNNATQWDEIRWGTDFASVTVIPEPSSAFLAGALGILPLLRRRRA